MRQILIYGGTTEGKRIAKKLSVAGIPCTVCVATEYGELVMPQLPKVEIRRGRLTPEEMKSIVMTGEYVAVVDATHPFAVEVTRNIKESLKDTNIPYYRLKRELLNPDKTQGEDERNVIYFETHEQCKDALEKISGNILLTTGSKELAVYASSEELKKRLYVRVLPSEESLKICKDNVIEGRQVIAMQGPFGVELNIAILKQFEISCMVTKESGVAGGFPEKWQAAKEIGIPLYVIGCPKEEGKSLEELCRELGHLVGSDILGKEEATDLSITLLGIGTGAKGQLTVEALKAIQEANYVYGAKRILQSIRSEAAWAQMEDLYLAKDIIPRLKDMRGENKIVIAFSGDAGFYSGCKKMHDALQGEKEYRDGNWKLRILPGISSVSYLAASTGYSWEDANILSVHGANGDYSRRVLDSVSHTEKSFVIVSGSSDVREIARQINNSKLDVSNVKMWVGYNLSYESEAIKCMSVEEGLSVTEEGLYALLIINGKPKKRTLTYGWKEAEFIRANIPMTKEEIRQISISKLQLREDSIVYDIGCGTGSVAVEIGALSPTIKVFGIEKKPEAASLIRENIRKHGTSNVCVVNGTAPGIMEELVDYIPTHAFLGGTSGNLEEILIKLYQLNHSMRVVVNAISLETIAQITDIIPRLKVKNLDIVSISVSRAKEAGKYHLMQGENPVYIVSFDFTEDN